MDSLQYVLHFLEHLLCRQDLVGSPKESYVEPAIEWLEQFFLQAISLSQLPLDAVPLDSPLEVTL